MRFIVETPDPLAPTGASDSSPRMTSIPGLGADPESFNGGAGPAVQSPSGFAAGAAEPAFSGGPTVAWSADGEGGARLPADDDAGGNASPLGGGVPDVTDALDGGAGPVMT